MLILTMEVACTQSHHPPAPTHTYDGDISVNSQTSLDFALSVIAEGTAVTGDVSIYVTTTVDQVQVQDLVDRIYTIGGTLDYAISHSATAETTFNNLTTAGDLILEQAGGYSFPKSNVCSNHSP